MLSSVLGLCVNMAAKNLRQNTKAKLSQPSICLSIYPAGCLSIHINLFPTFHYRSFHTTINQFDFLHFNIDQFPLSIVFQQLETTIMKHILIMTPDQWISPSPSLDNQNKPHPLINHNSNHSHKVRQLIHYMEQDVGSYPMLR